MASTASTLGAAEGEQESASSCTTDSGDKEGVKETHASAETTESPVDGGDAEGESDDEHPKSVYGASILLKLQWEDRTVQKKVPLRTYKTLGMFLSDVTCNLRTALQGNASAAQFVIDAIAFELTPLLVTRYLDGMETCTGALEHGALDLLRLLATHANAKEMHIAIKKFTSKIDSTYLEATSYLALRPVLSLWGDVIPRIPQKRRLFVNDYVKVFDRMLPCAEAFETSFIPNDGIGVEQSGRIAGIPDTLLDFLDKLADAQIRQMKDGSISVEVDVLGTAHAKSFPEKNKESADSETEEVNKNKEKGDGTEGKTSEKKSSAAPDPMATTTDWILERAIALAKVLDVQSMIWSRLPAPPGEDRNVPKKKSKSRKKNSTAKQGKMVEEQKEESLDKCAALFLKLGWNNPAVVCQLARNGLSLDPASRHEELMKLHIGTKSLSRKQKMNTLYSATAVGQYICGALRMWTKRPHEAGMEGGAPRDPYDKIDLSGTAFELLEPFHCLDLVMPYLAPVVMQAGVAVSLAGIVTLRAFLDRIPDGRIKTFDEILRLRNGTASFGREINLFGMAHHVGKALAGYDDPKHRRIGYETLQAMLRKCASPVARYVLCEAIFYETTRNAIAAQLMTEMKDAVRYADISWRDTQGDSDRIVQASHLRSRLSEDTIGRYFIPRKELLGFMNPLCTVSNLVYFLVRSDPQLLEKTQDKELRNEIEKRLRFCQEYGRLGKQLLRAIASVAEHDRRKIPESALAKKNTVDAAAIFQASGRTLNQCVGSISLLDAALQG
ncbi:unnamed protein product [Chondrus crispus]|uniref:Uncharacterized protein n=1 Tax=Chondrus crispus TaxID=2769 RepID=R7QVK8_CHOCR|nr:unnamed protein product [Chondrus crispus]CDF41360.1 unnamed protein product [Chondrus crispus]|eukprot:XP_005711654.1 unnamed protein product [Chondrus crispus]